MKTTVITAVCVSVFMATAMQANGMTICNDHGKFKKVNTASECAALGGLPQSQVVVRETAAPHQARLDRHHRERARL